MKDNIENLQEANNNLLNDCIMKLKETKDLSTLEVINMCIDNKVILSKLN